jgi:hypothetical protein
MIYKPIEVDKKNMTIMGVYFPDLETLNRVSSAIGSNMFEGFEPSSALLEIYRDYSEGKISSANLVEIIQGVL